MVTVNHSIDRIVLDGNRSWVVTWASMANGDTGEFVTLPAHADRSVQLGGTFSTGGTVVIEGSNDQTNYLVLDDFQGNALSFTTADLESISQVTERIRPDVTAGDGSTSINVYLLLTGAL